MTVHTHTLKELIQQYATGNETDRNEAIAAILEELHVEKLANSRSQDLIRNSKVPVLAKDPHELFSEAQVAVLEALNGGKIDLSRDEHEISQFIRNNIYSHWNNLRVHETRQKRYHPHQFSLDDAKNDYGHELADKHNTLIPKDYAAIIRERMQPVLRTEAQKAALEEIILAAEENQPLFHNSNENPLSGAVKATRFKVREKIRRLCADLLDDARSR